MLPVKTFEERILENAQASNISILDRLKVLHLEAASTLTSYLVVSGSSPQLDKGFYVLLLSALEDQKEKFLNALEPSEN